MDFTQNHQPSATFISSQEFLQVIARASRNYQEQANPEKFISYLRYYIFCNLGNVFVEIYFQDETKNQFIPYPSQSTQATTDVINGSTGVPALIPTEGTLFAGLMAHHTSLFFTNGQHPVPAFLSETNNHAQAIFPIWQGETTTALLYIGCREKLIFPEEYLQGIETIALLISSWMKSMDLIANLKSSMASLEYSEQLQQTLYEISEQAHQTTTEEKLFSSLHKIVGRLVNAKNFLVALREERAGEQYLKFVYCCDEYDSDLQGKEFKLVPGQNTSLTEFIIKNDTPLLLTPENFNRFCQQYKTTLLGTKASSLIGVPFHLDHLDGLVMVQSYNDIIYNEKDKDLLIYVAGQIKDALARKKALDDMRDANEMFSLFMRYSPVYVIIKEVTESYNRVVQASENFVKITGIPSSDMVGMSMLELFEADFAAKMMADDYRIVSSGVPMQLEQYLGGKIFNTIKFSIRQKDKTLLAAYSLDITKSKKAEEALRKSEHQYRIIFEKSPLGIVSFNPAGEVQDCNDKFAEIMGSTKDKLLGFYAAKYSTPIVQQALKQSTTGQIVYCEDSYTSVTGGKMTYLRGIFSPLVPGSPETEVIATIEDISEQKEHEKEQHKMDKLESLGVLAGGIAHDFNNILTGIMANISFARILLEKEHKASNSLTEAEKASRRAAELAQQLLTFARGGEPHKKMVSVKNVIQEAVSLMLRGSNVKATIEIPDTIHAAEIDEGQINQVLNNIILNSTQAMPGGGTLSIIAKNEFLLKSNNYKLPGGPYIKLTLQDEGCGISPEVKDKIFDPYFTTKLTGTGLGLASAYSIIAKHKGHIAVDSQVGQGTTFTVFLPSIGKSYPEHLEAISDNEPAQRGGNILVMDDEEMILDIAKTILGHLGYSVTTCKEGQECISLYQKSLEAGTPYWAVIVDLTIPGGLGGLEAAKQILAIAPSACLIVSSGYSNDPTMANFADFGFSAAMAKPYSVSEFKQALNSLPEN